jgi:type II secretory pathway component PulF
MFFSNELSVKSKSLFIRQLSTMLSSGLSPVRALQVLAEDPLFSNISHLIHKAELHCHSGNPLSSSLKVFLYKPLGKWIISFIKIAEQTGSYESIFKELDEILFYSYEIESRIKAVFLFPSLAFLFLLLGFTTAVNGTIQVVLALLLPVIIYGVKSILSDPSKLFGLLSFMPLFGKIIFQFQKVLYLRCFALIYESGYPLNQSGEVLVELFDSRSFIIQTNLIFSSIKQGKSISESFKRSSLFNSVDVNSIETGEISGRVHEIIMRITFVQKDELESFVNICLKIITPFASLLGSAMAGGAIYIFITKFLRPS